MSIDRSLKIKGALSRHRNVLTRAERVAKLKDEEKWVDGDSVFGLAKVVHRKGHTGRKIKAEPAKQPEGQAAATVQQPVAGTVEKPEKGVSKQGASAKPGRK